MFLGTVKTSTSLIIFISLAGLIAILISFFEMPLANDFREPKKKFDLARTFRIFPFPWNFVERASCFWLTRTFWRGRTRKEMGLIYWRLGYARVILFWGFCFTPATFVALKLELSKTSFAAYVAVVSIWSAFQTISRGPISISVFIARWIIVYGLPIYMFLIFYQFRKK